MLVFQDKKALVVRPRNPQQLLTLIPTAKPLTAQGKEFVAVPHRLDETKVLRNLGMRPPSPIRYYYKWSGQYTPFKAQLETAEFLSLHTRAFVLSEIGTGKSVSTLWAYDYLRSIGVVNKLLIVCPMSTMERTWGDELVRNFPHLDFAVLHGSRARRNQLLANREIDVYIVNHHGAGIIADELKTRPDIDIVAIDELAQCARNASTDMWKALNYIVNKQLDGTRYVWGLTGTPTPNAPTDAWAQCRLISPSTVPNYFVRFKDQVMRQVTNFLWVPRPNAMEVVHKAMQPSIRFSRAECVDLPPCLFQTVHVPLNKAQAAAYKDMAAQLHFQANNGEVTAVNEAVKAAKLVQIACGIAYDTDGNEVVVGAQERLDEVLRIVQSAEGKVIVFVPFVSSIRYVTDFLRKQGLTVATIHGAVPKHERDTTFGAFQNTNDPRVLVAQPGSMSHGLTLTAANTVIWYAPIFSNDIYDQACGRITRPGQVRNQLIVNIEGSPMELKVYERLKNKQRMQGILLSLVEDSRESATVDNQ